jgi:diguanylate cyclase (GGDEF)-like protein
MKIITYLDRLPKSFLEASAYIVLAIIGIADFVTGTEISFSLFYLAPIFLVTWFRSRGRGVLISIVAAITWLLADRAAGQTYSHHLIPIWNALIRFGFFIITTLLLSSLKNTLELKEQLTKIDFLTGATNARSFSELADLEINRAKRYQHPFTLAYIDLDNFKTVNDTYGHLIGDSLLRLVADTIRNNIRTTDVLARLGGDEFAILLPETDSEQSEIAINKVQTQLLDEMKNNNWPVTFSIGTITFLKPPESVDEMIKKADNLMYSAKKNGKNTKKREVWSGNHL